MYLLGFGLYVLASAAIAWLLATMLTLRAKHKWSRWGVAALLAPIVFLLPVADEIVGYFQFERLCEEAKEVKIYGTLLAGEDLYRSDGQWRIGLQEGDPDQRLRDWKAAQKALDTYVRRDLGALTPQEVPATIPIYRYDTRIFDVKTGKMLAEWRKYGTNGGWLSQRLGMSGDNIIVRQQCMPELVRSGKINQSLLIFEKKSETAK